VGLRENSGVCVCTTLMPRRFRTMIP
jgi:hypothetical protein